MKVDGAIANLLQGISQQKPGSRLPGQCTMQINAVNDVVDGWKRRPPTEYIAGLLGLPEGVLRWHFYDTGLEQYIVCIAQDGSLFVFDLLGNAQSITGASTRKSILSFTAPDDISLVTVGDYTIIANSKAVPAMDTNFSEAYTNTALLYLKDGGEYGRTYTMNIAGVRVASYTSPGGSTPATDARLTGTDYVTAALFAQLVPASNVLQGSWVVQGETPPTGIATGNMTFKSPFGTTSATATAQLSGAADTQVYTLTYTVVTPPTGALKATGFCANTNIPIAVGVNTVDLTCTDYSKPLTLAHTLAGDSCVLSTTMTLIRKSYDPVQTVVNDYTYKLSGNIIELTRIAGTEDIPLTVSDDRGGQFAKVIQRQVAKPGDLPKFATPGQIVQVTGEGSSDKDDYYLKFVIEHGENTFGTQGIWRECSKPGVQRRFNAATMPHALIRLPDNSWVFTPVDGSAYSYTGGTFTTERWRYRSSGDELTNKEPAFIGKSISAVGTFQDRLYTLSDEGAVFSATNSYFNFFNKTATTILDSDPVDMPSAGNSIVKLRKAVQHDKNLIIFADKAQFVVSGAKELTPKTSMVLTTSYDSSLACQPVAAGAGVLFPITYGNFGGLREFITSGVSDTNSSQPITAHVPKLLAGTIKHMVSNSNFDVVLSQSTGAPTALYVYKYLWQESERKQAAWGIWEFKAEVSTVFIKGAAVYVVLKYTDGYRLEKLDLTDVPAAGMQHNTFLDARCLITPVGNVLTIPYPAADAVVVQGPDCQYPGTRVPVLSAVGSTLTLAQTPAGACFVGYPFNTKYVPTMPVIKDQAGGVINNVNFILGKFMIAFSNTGHFKAAVVNPHYPTYETAYSGRTLGFLTNLIGESAVATGVFEVAVRKDAKHTTLEIETSTHLPMNLTAIEWEGDYKKTGRRL